LGLGNEIDDTTSPPEEAAAVGAFDAILAVPYLLYGVWMFCIGTVMYLVGVLAVIPRYLMGLYDTLTPVSEWLVWYSGVPMVAGLALALFDLLALFDRKRKLQNLRVDTIRDAPVTVAPTA